MTNAKCVRKKISYFVIRLTWRDESSKPVKMGFSGHFMDPGSLPGHDGGMDATAFAKQCISMLRGRGFQSSQEVRNALNEAFCRWKVSQVSWNEEIIVDGKVEHDIYVACGLGKIERVEVHFSERAITGVGAAISMVAGIVIRSLNPLNHLGGAIGMGMRGGGSVGPLPGTKDRKGVATAEDDAQVRPSAPKTKPRPSGQAEVASGPMVLVDQDADGRVDVSDFGSFTMDFAEPAEPEIHPVRTSQVQFRAVAPAVLEKGNLFPLKIMMYEEDYRAMAEEMASQIAQEVQEEETGFFEVARSSRVRIRLSSKDIDVEGEEDEVTWQGKLSTFSFHLELPEDYAKKQVRLEGRVYVNSLALTSIKLLLDVQVDRPQVVQIVKEPYRSAFISYASKDREEVMKRVQGMHALSPEMDIFTDVEKLRTGEMWEQRIFEEIHRRDILYLCWSRNAAESTWVNKEWRYAFAEKGQMGIEPLPIEPPELAPPPEALQCRHFGDWTLRYMRFKNEQI